MPRKQRVENIGFHHIFNKSIENKKILQCDLDKEIFLEILNSVSKKYTIKIHSYCIMASYYHILIETKLENLSLAIRHLNSSYATYYNNKNSRSGPLWNGRFKSWYISNKKYKYIIFKYIESIPVLENETKNIAEYKYSLSYNILNLTTKYNTFILNELGYEKLINFLNSPIKKRVLEHVYNFQKEKIVIKNKKVIKKPSLLSIFKNTNSKNNRNIQISSAFEKGYTQSEIARYLKLSSSTISKIIKENENS